MKIFYYCYSRAHSSVIAGNIHLERLPSDRIPSIKEILAVPEFDQSQPEDQGIPYYLGKDHLNNEIYLIGLGKNRAIALQTIYFLIKEYSDQREWRFFNALDQIDFTTKIGGFLSRKLKIVTIGRYLAAYGIQKKYFQLVKLVKSARELNPIE